MWWSRYCHASHLLRRNWGRVRESNLRLNRPGEMSRVRSQHPPTWHLRTVHNAREPNTFFGPPWAMCTQVHMHAGRQGIQTHINRYKSHTSLNLGLFAMHQHLTKCYFRCCWYCYCYFDKNRSSRSGNSMWTMGGESTYICSDLGENCDCNQATL